MNRAELKANAKMQIKGKNGVVLLITIIIGIISGLAAVLLNLVPMGSLAVSVIITPAFAFRYSRHC